MKGEKALTIFWSPLSRLKKLRLKFWKWKMKRNDPPFLKIPLTQFHKKLLKSFLSPCLIQSSTFECATWELRGHEHTVTSSVFWQAPRQFRKLRFFLSDTYSMLNILILAGSLFSIWISMINNSNLKLFFDACWFFG